MRSLADNALEDRGEMGLRLKADAERDLRERRVRTPKQVLRDVNPPPQ